MVVCFMVVLKPACLLAESSTPAVSKQSARWQVSKELCQTESNYVDILNTILQVGVSQAALCAAASNSSS